MATYLWDFGDGGTSTKENPLHTYATAGTYTVSLRVNAGSDSETVTKADYVVVSPAGNIQLQAGGNLQYLPQYEAWSGDEADPFASAWNTSTLPTVAPTFDGDILTWTAGSSPCTVITSPIMPPDPANGVIEFKILGLYTGYATTVGVWCQGFGPPFNPNSPTAGSVIVAWANDGRQISYGSESSSEYTYTASDVIGVYADLYSNTISFFKNGVYQFQLNTPTTTVWPIAGLYSPPS